jgi:hypothetical protein
VPASSQTTPHSRRSRASRGSRTRAARRPPRRSSQAWSWAPYPPFRLDRGDAEPAWSEAPTPPTDAGRPAWQHGCCGRRRRREQLMAIPRRKHGHQITPRRGLRRVRRSAVAARRASEPLPGVDLLSLDPVPQRHRIDVQQRTNLTARLLLRVASGERTVARPTRNPGSFARRSDVAEIPGGGGLDGADGGAGFARARITRRPVSPERRQRWHQRPTTRRLK